MSFGTTHLLMLLAFVVLVLDSRRFHALARLTGRAHRGTGRSRGIPAGANPDQVGLPLRQIQMRTNVDWQDGGIGREGPEILPVDESDTNPELDPEVDPETPPVPEPERNPLLPILWKPFPALLSGAVLVAEERQAELTEPLGVG